MEHQRIDKNNAEKIGKLGIIQALEGRRVFEHLNVEENLNVGAFARKDRKAVKSDLEMVYNYFPRLKQLEKIPLDTSQEVNSKCWL